MNIPIERGLIVVAVLEIFCKNFFAKFFRAVG